jgi:hypothetical protein
LNTILIWYTEWFMKKDFLSSSILLGSSIIVLTLVTNTCIFGSENVITKTRIFVDAEKYAIRQWVELDKLFFQIQVTYKGNTLKPCMAKCLDGYQFVILIIASGIVNNDNQKLDMHEDRTTNSKRQSCV